MPVVDRTEGRNLEPVVKRLTEAGVDPVAVARQLFVERLDFNPDSGGIPIACGSISALPGKVSRIACLPGVRVVLAQLTSDHIGATVIRALSKELESLVGDHLLIARAENDALCHVIHPRRAGTRIVLKRLVLERGRPLRTTVERLTTLYTARDRDGVDVRTALDRAFDVEAVTKAFYDGYEQLFRAIESELLRQSGDKAWAHDYALQLLNRTMFLYFLDRKGWLGEDFLGRLRKAYVAAKRPADSFFYEWIKVLFFEAFNKRFSNPSYMPPEIRAVLQTAPYLNGGLYARNDLDDLHGVHIMDAMWTGITDFFDGYNFTISESTPWDQEVAVDPEMIGKVYESLVNVSELDERGEAGIFYTPRTEIDLMCRLALVDNMANHLGQQHKALLYDLVFAVEPDERLAADGLVAEANLWSEVDYFLRHITVLDPACGSGSFLVGMLQVLDDLSCRANRELGTMETAYERKKRIIGESLYGVDVMKWAINVAELRLWLQLVIDTHMSEPERILRALLPNLTFNLRCGDSLVQEIGGVSLSHLHARSSLPSSIRGRLTRLKGEKLRFYHSEPGHLSQEEVQDLEIDLFRAVLDHQSADLDSRLREMRARLEAARTVQGQMAGMMREPTRQSALEEARLVGEIDRTADELAGIRRVRNTQWSPQNALFVWDLSFVEVFEGENGGFDIIIGNPPYVRQERIADPHVGHGSSVPHGPKEYREKLVEAACAMFPRFFGFKQRLGESLRTLGAKSDLYVYFFFVSLGLLNPQGTLCFVTSNSWLDVGYGTGLQAFLLRQCRVAMVVDNRLMRSFASADVNTVMSLVGAPGVEADCGQQHTVRFVEFSVPFAQALSARVFKAIENTIDRTTTDEFRVRCVSHSHLLSDGMDATAERGHGEKALEAGTYAGGKWGAKYLRAPDIYFTVLSKGSANIGTLATFMIGERYLNTGGADGFFIVTDARRTGLGTLQVTNRHVASDRTAPFEGEIEEEYLVPLIKDLTKTKKTIDIDGYDAHCLVVRGKPSRALGEYIRWGESQGYHLRSVTKVQTPWYKPTKQMLSGARVLVPRSFNDTFVIHHNPREYLSLRFYRMHPMTGLENALVSYLNSTLMVFIMETLGNKSLGQGVLDFFMADFLRMRIPIVINSDLEAAYESIRSRPIRPIAEELGVESSTPSCPTDPRYNPMGGRDLIDQLIFDEIGLTVGERDALYEAVVRMVESRIVKAASLNGVK